MTENGHLRVNLPLLAATIVVAVVTGSGIHVLHAYQIERNAETVLARAVIARDSGQNEQAIKLYSEYLGLKPGDTSGALSQMAVLLDDTARTAGEFSRVAATLEEASRQEPDRQDLRRRLVLVSIKLGRNQVAKAHWSKLTETPDGETAFLGGRIRQGLGDLRGAAAGYLKAIGQANDKIEYYLDLASLVTRHADDLALQEIDPEGDESTEGARVAERLLESMIEHGEPKYRAFYSRAALRKQQGRLDEAFDDASRALDAREDGDSLILAADIALAQVEAARLEGRSNDITARREVARELAERGLKLSPPDARLYLTLAQVEKQQGRLDAAEKQLRSGLSQLEAAGDGDSVQKTSNVEIQLRWSLADLLLDRAELEAGEAENTFQNEARSQITVLRRRGAIWGILEFLEARILLHQQQWWQASLKLEQMRSHLAHLPELVKQIDLSLGRCYDKLGNPDAKLVTFRRAIASDPFWVAGRMHLASALVTVKRYDEALAEYRRLIGSVTEAPLACAQSLILQNLSLPERQRRWDEIDRLLALAERAQPDSSQTIVTRSSVLAIQKKFQEAQSLLERATEQQPGDYTLLTALSNLWLRRDDLPLTERLDGARSILSAAEQAAGDQPELRLARIVFAGQCPKEKASQLLSKLEANLDGFSQNDRIMLRQQIALAYAQIGMRDKALTIWRGLAVAQPDDLNTRMIIVELAAREQDEPALVDCLADVRKIEGPNGPNGDFVEGSLLIQKAARDRTFMKELGRAGGLLRQAGKMRPNWPAVPRMMGWLEDILGNRDEALDHYRKAVALGDRSSQAVGLLVSHLYEQQRYDEADLTLRQVAEQQPGLLTGELARLASHVAWERHDFDRALKLAGDVADQSPDFRDLIRLSQLRFAQGESGEPVERPLRQAIELAPEQPETHIALVTHLSRTKRADDAQSAILQALKNLPPQVAYLTAARCFDVINDRKQARKNYARALEQRPDDVSVTLPASEFFIRIGETSEAERLLHAIVDPDNKAPEPAVALARRRLALVTAFKGGYENTTAALEMLEKGNTRNRSFEIADLRVKAAVLSRRNTRQDKRLLIQTWKEIADRQPLTPAEQFELSRLYEAVDDWPRAREILQSLIVDGRSNILLLTHYVQSLIANNEIDKATNWLTELESLAPKSFAVTVLKARALAAQGEDRRAAQLIEDLIQENPSDTNLAAAATVLSELGHSEIAESVLLDHQETLDANARLTLVTLVSRSGRIDQALELCEAARSELPTLAVAQMAVTALHASNCTAAQIAQVKVWLRKWLEAEPDSTVLLNYLANVCDLEQSFDEAESIYAAVLKKDPHDVVALNNAAYLAAVLRGKGNESLQLVNQAIRIAGPIASLLDTRAASYLALSDPQHAIRDLNNALDEKPSASAYIRLAQAQSTVNNRRAARNAMTKAKELVGPATNLHALDANSYQQLSQQLR